MSIDGDEGPESAVPTLAEAFQGAQANLRRAASLLDSEVHLAQTAEAVREVIYAVDNISGIVNALMWNDTHAAEYGKFRAVVARFFNVYGNTDHADSDTMQVRLFETFLQAAAALGMKVPKDVQARPFGYYQLQIEPDTVGDLAARVGQYLIGIGVQDTDIYGFPERAAKALIADELSLSQLAGAIAEWQADKDKIAESLSGKTASARTSAPNPDAARS